MGYLIVPLTKSAWRRGRLGPVEWQDWYCGLLKARALQAQFKPSTIAVITNCQSRGDEHEMDNYERACHALGLRDVLFLRQGLDTTDQIAIAVDVARSTSDSLVIVSSFLHYSRVRWLSRGFKATHVLVWGIPRPIEAFTDIILTALFPIIEILGLEEWFLSKVKARHEQGKYF